MTDKMTIEQAFNYIQEVYCGGCQYEFKCDGCLWKTIKDTLLKQIPMKPIHTYKRCGFIVEGCCPVCGEPVVLGERCSSNSCGQAIDWESDTE